MNRLADKVAVITGAGSGIGRASARVFVAEGAKVVVAEIDETLGEASAREAGAGARFVRTDVTDEESVKQMVRQARDAFGRIDVLLNCAGGSVRDDKPVTEVDLAVWDHTINLDMKGPFLCCRHVIPVMVEQAKGSVVNFSSVVALRGNHIAHVYVSAKGGLIAFTRALAGAYSPKGIRVNAICPGIVLTDRVKSRFTGGNQIRFGGMDNVAERYPFGVGQPEDIANIALFLASDESRMVNGAAIPAEGGISAY
ncbi:glucose 1-dehydrogenase [Reyranella sp.]|jgi:NAD(P)-dependent dehydrogenase (short-subunit alcohol dehydrogenase family)|uniref:SDR family NAD(P)-dependent oxidoreductase n=1 Tax=Reyranella sp. TaxID=1929291 RepID=UPI002F927188